MRVAVPLGDQTIAAHHIGGSRRIEPHSQPEQSGLERTIRKRLRDVGRLSESRRHLHTHLRQILLHCNDQVLAKLVLEMVHEVDLFVSRPPRLGQ